MPSNKNNFRKPENKEKSLYRLVIYWKDSYIGKYGNRKYTIYYSYNTKTPEAALNALRNVAKNKFSFANACLIYDNKSGDLIDKLSHHNPNRNGNNSSNTKRNSTTHRVGNN